MHALGEYGLMHVKLYEDIARFGHIATSYAYPVKVNARYVMDPSPTPKFDNPKMDNCPALLQLFGAGREKRIYAIPPHTSVVSLDFEDHPFTRYRFDAPCALCGADDFLPRRNRHRRTRAAGCSSAPTPTIAKPARRWVIAAAKARLRTRRDRMANHPTAVPDCDQPLLVAEGLSKSYGRLMACRDVSFALYPGEWYWRSSASPARASRPCCNCCRRS